MKVRELIKLTNFGFDNIVIRYSLRRLEGYSEKDVFRDEEKAILLFGNSEVQRYSLEISLNSRAKETNLIIYVKEY